MVSDVVRTEMTWSIAMEVLHINFCAKHLATWQGAA